MYSKYTRSLLISDEEKEGKTGKKKLTSNRLNDFKNELRKAACFHDDPLALLICKEGCVWPVEAFVAQCFVQSLSEARGFCN